METHNHDSECTLDRNDVCNGCGVYHGDPCPSCGGRGYHEPTCDDRPLEVGESIHVDGDAHETSAWLNSGMPNR